MRVMKDFINDADYKVAPIVNGKVNKCPYYSAWRGMIARICSKQLKGRNTYYKNVDCCDDWLYFMNFRKWAENYQVKGMHLDKDILSKDDSKLYSPENCAFVPQKINKLFLETTTKRGLYPIGVHYVKKPDDMVNEYTKPFAAKISSKWLGMHATEEDAHCAWQAGKEAAIRESAENYKSCVSYRKDVYDEIMRRADILKSDRENSRITISLNKFLTE